METVAARRAKEARVFDQDLDPGEETEVYEAVAERVVAVDGDDLEAVAWAGGGEVDWRARRVGHASFNQNRRGASRGMTSMWGIAW